MEDLKTYRDRIDKIDKQIVDLFEKRMKTVNDIARYKKNNNIPIFQKEREHQVIEKVKNYTNDTNLKEYIGKLFLCIMDISKKIQSEEIDN